MSSSAQQIEISLSKEKLIFKAIGSLVFIALGILIVSKSVKYSGSLVANQTMAIIVGLSSVLFFGLCFFFFVKKLFDKTPGLVISEEGIYDNSGAVSAGQIQWTEIEGIAIIEISRQKLIMLKVKNPQDYIDKQSDRFYKMVMTMNYKMFGSPIHISSIGLKISFIDLLSMLTEKLRAIQK